MKVLVTLSDGFRFTSVLYEEDDVHGLGDDVTKFNLSDAASSLKDDLTELLEFESDALLGRDFIGIEIMLIEPVLDDAHTDLIMVEV